MRGVFSIAGMGDISSNDTADEDGVVERRASHSVHFLLEVLAVMSSMLLLIDGAASLTATFDRAIAVSGIIRLFTG
jgi:hypothetical protein